MATESSNTIVVPAPPYKFRFSLGLKGTIEENSHQITVLADSYKDCWKKVRRYLDDEYETKGRELKAIVRHAKLGEDDRIDFEFCGRTITLYQLD